MGTRAGLVIKPIVKRFFWPHPYAVEAGWLWRKLTVGHRYFVDGVETKFHRLNLT